MKPSFRMSNVHRWCCPRSERVVPGLLAALMLASTSILAEEKLGHTLTPVEPPVAAPAFQLQDMDETELTLAAMQGRVVLLNFWATWCPPCRREMPSMERLYRALDGRPFTVIAVNQYESLDHVFAYLGQLDTDPSFPILFDPDSAVSGRYGVRGLPSTYLIDKRGRIRYRAVGGREFDHPEVMAIIESLMLED